MSRFVTVGGQETGRLRCGGVVVSGLREPPLRHWPNEVTTAAVEVGANLKTQFHSHSFPAKLKTITSHGTRCV